MLARQLKYPEGELNPGRRRLQSGLTDESGCRWGVIPLLKVSRELSRDGSNLLGGQVTPLADHGSQ